MTTNETFFFRDKLPFDHFRESIMPEMLRARASRKSIRIWCAAGSTGQEPYSLAMCLKEMGAFKQTGELWQLNADIRGMVQHRQLNLLHDFTCLGKFDIIFCRNVLIYFDQETKVNIFNRLAKVIEPDGFLVLGAAETVVGLTDVFKPFPERRGLYRPNAFSAAPGRMSALGAGAMKSAAVAGL